MNGRLLGNREGTCVPLSAFIRVYVKFYLAQRGSICQTAPNGKPTGERAQMGFQSEGGMKGPVD